MTQDGPHWKYRCFDSIVENQRKTNQREDINRSSLPSNIMLEIVRQKYTALTNNAQQQISDSDSFRVMFIEEVSKEVDISNNEIDGYLDIVIAATTQDLDALIRHASIGGTSEEDIRDMAEIDKGGQFTDWHNEMVLLPQAKALVVRARMEQGVAYQTAKSAITEEELRSVMQMLLQKNRCFFPRPENGTDMDKSASILLRQIEGLLMEVSPLTKSQILQRLGKDNGTYRDAANSVLYYLCFLQRIRKVDQKYYHITKAPTIYETDIHRRVYEALCHGYQSITAIAKNIQYDNNRGRKRVKTILTLLQSEGLVQVTDNKQYQQWIIS